MEEPIVGTLLEAFRTSHFSFASYYVLSFGVLPSGLRLELPVERSKETVDAVLKSIDLQRFAFEPRTRLWRTGLNIARSASVRSGEDIGIVYVEAMDFKLEELFFDRAFEDFAAG